MKKFKNGLLTVLIFITLALLGKGDDSNTTDMSLIPSANPLPNGYWCKDRDGFDAGEFCYGNQNWCVTKFVRPQAWIAFDVVCAEANPNTNNTACQFYKEEDKIVCSCKTGDIVVPSTTEATTEATTTAAGGGRISQENKIKTGNNCNDWKADIYKHVPGAPGPAPPGNSAPRGSRGIFILIMPVVYLTMKVLFDEL